MGDGSVSRRADFRYRADGAAFDLIVSKLHRPFVRPRTVRRSLLIKRLARDFRPIVSVVAPTGYGKTTLLSQWAERDGRAFAWVSVDERDNDPKVLLTYIAEALDAVQPVGQPVFDALASPVSSVPGSVVPRLGAAFSRMAIPVVLVLDDVHLLHNRECRAALSVLADHVPRGSRLVLAGRVQPPLRIGRLRVEGKILEIGPGDLALSRDEAASLLRNADIALGEDDVAELYQRTEGWAAGLYLATLCLRDGGPVRSASIPVDGADRFITEYMRSEFLARIPQRHREFLTRTAVLDRMSGPLCEAVLELPGSAAILADLARSNLLLMPLDRRETWYRYHRLFRDMLIADLDRTEPGLIPVLRRRAADWCLRNNLPEEALEYYIAAGDADAVALIVEKLALMTYRQGRVTTVQHWLGWLGDRDGIYQYPAIAARASLLSAVMGRPADADRWADAVDRWEHADGARPGGPPAEAWAALIRAVLCRHGIEQMHADADQAARHFAAGNVVDPMPALCQGIARILSGDLDDGDAFLEEAISAASQVGAAEALAAALCERCLVAMAHGQWDQVDDLADQARTALRRAGFEDSYITPLVCAVHARAAMHRADVAAARQELVHAQRLRPLLTYALPYLAAQTRIELARVHLALVDPAGARMLIREIDEILKRRPDLGTLVDEARAIQARLSTERIAKMTGASTLTTAELRVLPLLGTHLSLPEIAEELSLSRNTVKSQAISVYRKLEASSRNQAVNRARELGLLEG